VSDSGISWAICKSAPRSRHITTPATHHSVFYRPDAFLAAQHTASKHWRELQLTKLWLKKITTTTLSCWFHYVSRHKSRNHLQHLLLWYCDTDSVLWCGYYLHLGLVVVRYQQLVLCSVMRLTAFWTPRKTSSALSGTSGNEPHYCNQQQHSRLKIL